MNRLTPLQIRKISEIVALPSEMSNNPNYLSGQKLVDFFNAFGFGDDYRYPSIGIVTKDIGENLSRRKYAFERFNKLTQMGRMPEAIEHFLQSVQEPLEAQRKIQEILQQSTPHIDQSAYKNNYTPESILFTKIVAKAEYTQFEGIREDDIVVFISYAWDDEEHKQWVRKLSDDLRSRGIYTLLDDYNPGGVNLVEFMQKGIARSHKVLVIGSPRYKQKLDEGESCGVNFEDAVMTIEMYYGAKEKYIPVLRKGTFQTSYSTLMSVQTGYDFSDDDQYETQLSKLAADLKGQPLNAAPIVEKVPVVDNSTSVAKEREWEKMFHYSMLLPEEIELAYDSAIEVLANPRSLKVFELAKLIFILCKLDQDGVTLIQEHFQIMESALVYKFDEAPSFDELHEFKIEFYQTMDLCGYKHVDYPSLTRVLSFLRSLLDKLESEKKWLLVLYLEQLSEDTSKQLIRLHDTAPDNGTPYSSMPLFDKVDIEKMLCSIKSATPSAIMELGKFLIERYKLAYPLTSDNCSLEFKDDIEKLSILLNKLNEHKNTLKPIARLAFVDISDRIEKSIKRCEGDRRTLVY